MEGLEMISFQIISCVGSAKSAIKKIKNDLQSPCRKFSGRGFICVYKKLTKEITEKLQKGIKKGLTKCGGCIMALQQQIFNRRENLLIVSQKGME